MLSKLKHRTQEPSRLSIWGVSWKPNPTPMALLTPTPSRPLSGQHGWGGAWHSRGAVGAVECEHKTPPAVPRTASTTVPYLDLGVEGVGDMGACGHTSLRGHT